MKYILWPTQNDILHYGVDHLHSKTGRGSGRYAWGSGKEPGNKKISKKERRKTAGKHINKLHNQQLNEMAESERKWDDAMLDIVNANFDYYDEKFHLSRMTAASLREAENIQEKYNSTIKKYLIDTGLANEKMSSKKIGKIINKLEGQYIKSEKKRLNEAENFDPYKAMNKIDKSLSKKEKNLLGVGNDTANVPVEKFFFDKNKTAYLIATDYHNKYKDEHPISGKVLGIAAKKESRGTGITDKLISDAKGFYKNDKLVAEIDKDNTASRKLFERNGFKKEASDDYIDYYTWSNKRR